MIAMAGQAPLLVPDGRLTDEWNDPRLFTRVRLQAIYTNFLVWEATGYWTMLTDLFRTLTEQREICKKIGKPYYLSTHQLWRAGDQVPIDKNRKVIALPQSVGDAIAARVSMVFPYTGSPGKQSCIYHDVGLGSHFHHQEGYRDKNYRPDLSSPGGTHV